MQNIHVWKESVSKQHNIIIVVILDIAGLYGASTMSLNINIETLYVKHSYCSLLYCTSSLYCILLCIQYIKWTNLILFYDCQLILITYLKGIYIMNYFLIYISNKEEQRSIHFYTNLFFFSAAVIFETRLLSQNRD